jgi:hypothetical protein
VGVNENALKSFLTRGSSMLPAILPGSRLHVVSAKPEALISGDVVCYVGQGAVVVAHRVVRGLMGSAGDGLVVKGDSQSQEETLPASAVMYRVLRVERGLLSYETDGIVGRTFAHLALSNGPAAKTLQFSLRMGIRLAVMGKGLLRGA